jgi:hypothetical protein
MKKISNLEKEEQHVYKTLANILKTGLKDEKLIKIALKQTLKAYPYKAKGYKSVGMKVFKVAKS